VLPKAAVFSSLYKNFFRYIKTIQGFTGMQKNFGEIFSTIEIDTVSGEYYTTIPEQVINDLNLYEESEIQWNVDGDEAIIKERKE
tara:strand:+ start:57 stop:311 length:255 start_codon:yes stop_codon:yes gene_type:complete